jgi:hypothetical protein
MGATLSVPGNASGSSFTGSGSRRSHPGKALAELKRSAPGPVKSGARYAFRTYGMATAGIRPLPDFLIVGTKRGGTTSLYRYLLEHPAVLPTFPSFRTLKGVHYFDEHFARGLRWYRSHFPAEPYRALLQRSMGVRPLIGEASPNYLFHPLGAARAAGSVPQAKIIMLLRNPIDRAWSQYKDQVKLGFETLSFEDAIEREPTRLAGEVERMLADPGYYGAAFDRYSYLARGRYLDQLRAWRTAFPDEQQLLILCSEDLYGDAERVYYRVLDFLGLPPFSLNVYRPHNAIPATKMAASTRRHLAAYFAPYNRQLSEHLGTDLGWDEREHANLSKED